MYAYRVLRVQNNAHQDITQIRHHLSGRGNDTLWVHDQYDELQIQGPHGEDPYIKITAYQAIDREKIVYRRGPNGTTQRTHTTYAENETYQFFYPLQRSTLALLVGQREEADLDAHLQWQGQPNEPVFRALAQRKRYNLPLIIQNFQDSWKRGFKRNGAGVRAVSAWGQFSAVDPLINTIAAQANSTNIGIILNLGGLDRKITVFEDGRLQVMYGRSEKDDAGLLSCVSEAANILRAYEL